MKMGIILGNPKRDSEMVEVCTYGSMETGTKVNGRKTSNMGQESTTG